MPNLHDEPEYRAEVESLFYNPDPDEKSVVITVDKQGGGRSGRPQAGRWDVSLRVGGIVYLETITTGMPKTHHEVACIFADAMAANDEIEWPAYVAERLTMFAYEGSGIDI